MKLGTCPFSLGAGLKTRPTSKDEKGAPGSPIGRPVMESRIMNFEFSILSYGKVSNLRFKTRLHSGLKTQSEAEVIQ